jgi:hypothetical protein
MSTYRGSTAMITGEGVRSSLQRSTKIRTPGTRRPGDGRLPSQNPQQRRYTVTEVVH